MGQNQPLPVSSQTPVRVQKESPQPKHSTAPSFEENQGILKLRKVPFRNSIQISEHPPLFLENIPDTLADVMESRYNTKKYFSEHEIQTFVESVLYTLSFLETKNITYTDLSIQNIHYDQDTGVYKLLPLELIKSGIYEQALKSKNFGLLSPELILGLRYKEKEIQEQIMNKSNVFTFGMILLEMATLQPSSECYDTKYFEILDDVITERLQKVQEIYHPQIQKLIEMMIQYDYTKRMNLQELSILVNKTLAQNSVVSSSVVKKNKSFSRFRNIDESLSYEKSYDRYYDRGEERRTQKPEKQIRESVSRIHEKSVGTRNISPSRLKANTVLPVNYHQTPKRQSMQYTNTPTPCQEPPIVQQKFMPRQKSSRRIQCEQQLNGYQESYEPEDCPAQKDYSIKYQGYQNDPQYMGYPQQPIVSPKANYSRVMYCPPPPPQLYHQNHYQIPYQQQPEQYPPQYGQYQYPLQSYPYPPNQYQIPQHIYQPQPQPQHNYTPKNGSQNLAGSTIYPPSQKTLPNPRNTQTYYEPENECYDYNPPRRQSTSVYYNHQPSNSSIHQAPMYQQVAPTPSTPSRHNPYINYQQPPSKELSFQQQYEDSFVKNTAYVSPYNIPSRSQHYTPPHRDSNNYILKQSNAQRYDKKSSELSDLSDSSIVKIKEQIAKSRQLIMQLQKHDSSQRR